MSYYCHTIIRGSFELFKCVYFPEAVLGEVDKLHFGEPLVDQATTISKEICVPATTAAAKNYFLHAREIGNVLCALRPNKYMGTRVLRIHALLQTVVVCAFAAFSISSTATADTPGAVLAWGAGISNTGIEPENGQSIIPAVAQSGVSAIACGGWQTIILKEGKVYAWGDNGLGQCLGTGSNGEIIYSAPIGSPVKIMGQVLTGITAIASGMSHTIALKNGEVLVWGNYDWNQEEIPDAAKSGVTAIAGGHGHCIALKNGAVLAWGENDNNQCEIPGVASFGVSAIAGGYYHTIALKGGAVLAWGDNTYGQCTIPVAAYSGVTAIAGGWAHTIALKDGAVLAWGNNTFGQCTIPVAAQSGVTAIAGGDAHTIALKNGAVLAWGAGKINTGTAPNFGQSIIPTAANSGVTAIAVGFHHTIALKSLISLPTITTVSPTSGPLAAGTSFTITGTNLTGATSVKVNGVAATSVLVVSATSITAKTPAGTAGAKSLTVTTAGGTATKASAFTYVAAPTITSIAPTSGTTLGGTAFTITGTNLTGATSVKVNGVAATSVVVVSATSITARTPAGTAGAKSLTVTTAGGTATKASAFTYVVPAPTITSIAPTSGTTLGGTTFTIKGTNLTGATSVKVNGVAATSVVVVSATSITARTPAGTAGAKSVAVTTAGGTATKASAFTYVVPAPTITSIAPTSGKTLGGTAFTITGTNLTGATSVKVNGVAATSVVVVSATSITAKTPAGTAGAKSLTVTTAGGTATKASAFTYIAAPTITSISPTVGTTAGGTTVTITGTNLTGAILTVEGTSIPISNNTGTSFKIKTQAHSDGAISAKLSTPGGTVTRANAFTFVGAPTVTSISPTSGPTRGGTVVTITGKNLTGAKVTVAGTNIPVYSNTGTSFKLTTPAYYSGYISATLTTLYGSVTENDVFYYYSAFTGDGTESSGSGTGGDGRVTTTKTNGADASAAQATNDPAAETIVAAPMGVELYLQTISQHADAQVVCADASAASVDVANAVTDNVDAQAIDLDHNGEADICQLRLGDLNLNGVIDDADMSILLHMIGTEPLHGIGDLDGNGVIDSADMSLILLQMN